MDSNKAISLTEKINEGIKSALKGGEKLRLETLRSIRAGIIEFNKSGAGRDMNEEDGMKLLKSNAKKRRDAIAMYEKGGRQELADKEKAELEIILEFLPKQMSDDEINDFVKNIITELEATGMQDMGKVMGASMKGLKGKADGGAVQKAVRNILGAM